jgi:hypothetical protein
MDSMGRPVHTGLVRELRNQAKFTPHSMLKLDAVSADHGSSTEGRAFNIQFGQGTAAYYTTLIPAPDGHGYVKNPRSEIHVSPNAIDEPGYFRVGYGDNGVSGPGQFSAASDRPGLRATVAHEYGHHVTKMMLSDNPDLPMGFDKDVADRLFPDLATALNLKDEPVRRIVDLTGESGRGGEVRYQAFDAWVEKHQTVIRNLISGYSVTSGNEMLAEIWAEYTTRPSVRRPFIQMIGKLMQQIAEERAGKEMAA